MKVHLYKDKLGRLTPDDPPSEEWLRGLPQGQIMSCEVKRPRNYAHHSKFFAMLNLILQNQSHYQDIDDLLLAFKHAIGHGHWLKVRGDPLAYPESNTQIFQPHSISFASMGQDEFNAFYKKAINFVCTAVIPGLDRADLERELLEFAA